MKVCKSKLCLSKVYYLSWRKYNCCQWCEFIVSSVVIGDSDFSFRAWCSCHKNETINKTKIFIVRSGHSKSCQKRLKPFLNCSDGLASSSDIAHEELSPLQMCRPNSGDPARSNTALPVSVTHCWCDLCLLWNNIAPKSVVFEYYSWDATCSFVSEHAYFAYYIYFAEWLIVHILHISHILHIYFRKK